MCGNVRVSARCLRDIVQPNTQTLIWWEVSVQCATRNGVGTHMIWYATRCWCGAHICCARCSCMSVLASVRVCECAFVHICVVLGTPSYSLNTVASEYSIRTEKNHLSRFHRTLDTCIVFATQAHAHTAHKYIYLVYIKSEHAKEKELIVKKPQNFAQYKFISQSLYLLLTHTQYTHTNAKELYRFVGTKWNWNRERKWGKKPTAPWMTIWQTI